MTSTDKNKMELKKVKANVRLKMQHFTKGGKALTDDPAKKGKKKGKKKKKTTKPQKLP